MRILCVFCILCALLTAACLLASCTAGTAPSSSEESSETQSSASELSEGSEETEESEVTESTESSEESEESESLPPPEAIVLLYTDYLTVRAEQGGLVYEYTYCFDGEQRVFNAVAVIRFPTEEAAVREYNWLRRNSYPNLELEGTSLSFCFPRKECPFYGISYRSLEVLLEETVYEIIERHPPEEPAETTGEA